MHSILMSIFLPVNIFFVLILLKVKKKMKYSINRNVVVAFEYYYYPITLQLFKTAKREHAERLL